MHSQPHIREEMDSILFKKEPGLSMRTEGIFATTVKCFTSENIARFFDINESKLRKVNHKAHRIFGVDATGTTDVQHRHGKVVSMRQNISRKRKSNNCCHLYECHWNICSTINHVKVK